MELSHGGLTAELWDDLDSDDDSDKPVGSGHHALVDCSGYVFVREPYNHRQPISESAQQAGQIPHMNLRMRHEPSLVWWVCARPQTDIQSINHMHLQGVESIAGVGCAHAREARNP